MREISKKMKAKLDGPLGCGRDGVLYLKRQLEFSENGIDLSCNAKYIPKLVKMLHVTERRGKSVPGHHGLQVYDSETISESEFLNTKDANIQIWLRSLHLHFSRTCRHPTQCSCTCKLHGQANKISNGWSQETCLLSQLHQRDEDSLPKGGVAPDCFH